MKKDTIELIRDKEQKILKNYSLDSTSQRVVLNYIGKYLFVDWDESENIFMSLEPCGQEPPFLSIYYAEEGEKGYYVFDNIRHFVPVLVAKAVEAEGSILLSGFDATYLNKKEDKEHMHEYKISFDEGNIWQLFIDGLDTLFMVSESAIVNFAVKPCTSFNDIFSSFPNDWTLVKEDEETNEMYILEECVYGFSRLTFAPSPPGCDGCKPDFTLWDGGDSFDHPVDSIWKKEGLIYLLYSAMGQAGMLRIEPDKPEDGLATFYYSEPGLKVDRFKEIYVPSNKTQSIKLVKENCD